MNPNSIDKLLNIATEAAKSGGKVLEQFWGKLISIQKKEFTWDLVTEADKKSEEAIIKILKTEFPDHSILAEESGLHSIEGTDYAWVVDPLDGTTNYTHQYPMVSVSIGLIHQEKPIVGVVYNPIHKELFQAAEGRGTKLNGNKIFVSKNEDLSHSLLATGFAYDRRDTIDNNYTEFCHITHLSQGVRRGGSAALDLAYVAAGRLDGFWERGLKPWDTCAGIVLIQEAGGKVTSYEGGPLILESGRILATNGIIHDILSEELRNAHQTKYF
jgi:myo-inositol-1(or 4)-monophosphatase